MTPTRTRKTLPLAAAATLAAAAALPTRPARAATTLTWDADPAQPGAQGGAGTWANNAGGWHNGTANVNWNNANLDSAVFAGPSAGLVTLSGTATAKYLTFDVPGYTLAGGQLTFGSPGNFDSGVHANADVTINSDVRTTTGTDGWTKDGPGTLTLGGNNSSGIPFHLKSGTVAFATKANPPRSIVFDGDNTSRVRYTGGGASIDVGSALTFLTVGTVDVPDTGTRFNLVAEMRGAGLFVKTGAGTFSPSHATTLFNGTARVEEGTLRLTSRSVINARPVQLNGGTLALDAATATDFGSPVTARGGPHGISVGGTAAPTGASHTLPGLSVISGTLNVTSNNGWGLNVGSVTNGGTIDLNDARLTVTAGGVSPFANSPGTFRFGHAPAGAAPTARGLWVAHGQASTVASQFAGQAQDADLLVGVRPPTGASTPTLLTLNGAWRGGGGSATSTLAVDPAATLTFGPDLRFNNLTADRTALRPVRVWGGNGTTSHLVFDPAFVADRTEAGAVDTGLGDLQLSNATWTTHHTQSLPAVTRRDPGGAPAGTHRAGLVTFDNFSNPGGIGAARWRVQTTDQTYDGGVLVKQKGRIDLDKRLTHTGRVGPHADNAFQIAANQTLDLHGFKGSLRLSGDLGFAPGSRINGNPTLVTFDTDPGAGWYAGNYARDPATGAVTAPPTPAHTLALHVGNNETGGAIFNAPVTRLKDLSLAGTAVVSLRLLPDEPQKVLSIGTRLSYMFPKYWLDLTDNALILRAAPDHTDASVRTLLAGGNIRSSAADAAHALGYARAAEVLPPPGAAGGGYAFLGQAVAANDVLVRYTLFGDANLDGAVDFADLVRLAQHYDASVAPATGDSWWAKGDFTGDGAVDFADLVKLAQNYETSLPAGPAPGAPASFSRDLAAAFASVPEPSTALALIAACGLAGLGRRHRRAARAAKTCSGH
jgi:hypothetical protein